MENLFSHSDQRQVLRKRSDIPQDDSFEKEVSTDNSYLSLDRANSTPIHSVFDGLTLNGPQDLPSTSPNPVATASQPTAKCAYCDVSVPKDELFKHEDDCDKRKINCEACGETINIDIFDFHLEMCTNRGGYGIYQNLDNYAEYQNGGYGYTMNYGNSEQPQSGEAEPNEENANQAEQGGQGENLPEPEHESEEEEEDEYGFDPDTLTYEQLIYLDNFIEKKGMTTEEIAKFPAEVHLKELDGVSSCSVCISDFESGELTRKLPCGHKFHKDCIDTWMDMNITCPICKKFLR